MSGDDGGVFSAVVQRLNLGGDVMKLLDAVIAIDECDIAIVDADGNDIDWSDNGLRNVISIRILDRDTILVIVR